MRNTTDYLTIIEPCGNDMSQLIVVPYLKTINLEVQYEIYEDTISILNMWVASCIVKDQLGKKHYFYPTDSQQHMLLDYIVTDTDNYLQYLKGKIIWQEKMLEEVYMNEDIL
jgi:hypothetical protein